MIRKMDSKTSGILCTVSYVCSRSMCCPCKPSIIARHSTLRLEDDDKFSGSIWKRLVTCHLQELHVSSFESVQITEQLSNVDPKEWSTDQQYLLWMCKKISKGEAAGLIWQCETLGTHKFLDDGVQQFSESSDSQPIGNDKPTAGLGERW